MWFYLRVLFGMKIEFISLCYFITFFIILFIFAFIEQDSERNEKKMCASSYIQVYFNELFKRTKKGMA